jgi:uncharacterized lipoprotein YbaY
MNRISPISFVVLIPLVLLAAAHASGVTAQQPKPVAQLSRASAPPPPPAIQVTLTHHERELAPLAPDARVIVQLIEISPADGTESVLDNQVFELAGRSAPFEFKIGYNRASIRPENVYSVTARIAVDGQVAYQATMQLGAITLGHPREVQLALAKVGAWSALDMAVSSGHLARFSH